MRISLDDISLDRELVAANKSPKTKAPYTFTIRNETWTSLEVVTQQDPPNPTPDVVAWFIPNPRVPKPGRIQLLGLPADIIYFICRCLDICSSTCLGLTCKAFFNITEHLYPFQANLYTRTLPSRKCLGQLLTQWMAPKYSFDHSWGKYRLKRHYVKDEAEVERRWKEKETWQRIRLVMDDNGAVVAYRAKRRGFEEREQRLPFRS